MEKPTYTITAKTQDEFNKIEERLNALPGDVLKQVENARFGACGVHCTFKKLWGESIKIALPDDCRQITDFGNYEGCYTERCFFEVPIYDRTKVKITYYFVKYPEIKE